MSHMSGHNLQVYAGMIASDRSVGKIVEKLKDLNIYGKTMIIFTSDNGGANYIELEDINKPFRGWKISFFEGGIRVPFIVSWPDEINPGLILTAQFIILIFFQQLLQRHNVNVLMKIN